ncbi:MAG: hypothetical protein ABSB35_06370 [Bryobacteraceae bacterium]
MASRPPSAKAASNSPFAYFQEFFGASGYSNPQAAEFLQGGTINGLTFTPPVVPGMAQLASTYGAGIMLRLPGAAAPAAISDIAIETQQANFEAQAASNPQLNFIWDLMPEWDQSGGAWVPQGRPSYVNLSKAAAYAKFINYYRQSYPALMNYLNQPAGNRKYRISAVTDYSANTFYAYEMGVDLCLLERSIDELADLSTGIAFLRGAARQYGRAWGIDLSSWRTSNDMATRYTNQNVLLGGWSASYLTRHSYVAFASGANMIQNEAATYSNPDGQLNPLAAATQAFADFALHRHPNLGSPAVSTAFLIDHDSGFDPKHGVYNQANAVWYQDIPYSNGDFMIDNLFRLAYPNHWLHGLTPGAPFANSSGIPNTAGFRAFLSGGGDPRPYEPMPSTRWGDNLDIITTGAQAAALRQYKVIVLLGDVHLSSGLREDLRIWVEKGGVLVINSNQMTPADADLVGVTVTSSSPKSGTSSRWLSSRVSQSEAPYTYTPVRPVTAQVLAINENSDPLITQQDLGTGEVLLTTPSYMQSSAQNGILEICTQLLDSLMAKNSVASIAGPPVEYIVSQGPGSIVVTVVNNSGSDWTGTITVDPKDAVTAVSEYTADQPVEFAASPAGATIPGQVPAYGVRVFGIEYAPTTLAKPPLGKKSARAPGRF